MNFESEIAQKAREDLFKTALNEETEVDSLLAYYRERIANFEKERFEWIGRFEQVKLSQEEKHRTEWDLRRAKDEIADLQRALSDARLKIFEEKQLNLKLSSENAQLMERADLDKNKIGNLVNACNLVEQKIVFKRNEKPSIMTKFVNNNDLNIEFHKTNTKQKNTAGPSRVDAFVNKNTESKAIYKTMILNSNNDDLDQSLQNHLANISQSVDQAADNKLLSCHLSTLREELDRREREIQIQREELNKRMEELSSKNKKIEKLNIELNKEFFAQRVRFEQVEHRLQQENELLRMKNVSIANQLGEVKSSAELENKITKDLVEKRSIEYAEKFKVKARKKEDKLTVVKDQYKKVQTVYIEKISQLESNLRSLKDQYTSLKKKKNLEIAGYKSEIKNLQTQFKILLRDIELETSSKTKLKEKKPSSKRLKGAKIDYYDGQDQSLDATDLHKMKNVIEGINNNIS